MKRWIRDWNAAVRTAENWTGQLQLKVRCCQVSPQTKGFTLFHFLDACVIEMYIFSCVSALQCAHSHGKPPWPVIWILTWSAAQSQFLLCIRQTRLCMAGLGEKREITPTSLSWLRVIIFLIAYFASCKNVTDCAVFVFQLRHFTLNDWLLCKALNKTHKRQLGLKQPIEFPPLHVEEWTLVKG